MEKKDVLVAFGNEAKNEITEEKMIVMTELLMNGDIEDIKNDMAEGDYMFLTDILQGNGWTQYGNLTKEQLVSEFLEREFYGDESVNALGVEAITNELLISLVLRGNELGKLAYPIEIETYFDKDLIESVKKETKRA